ncbi:hypothetical protein D3C72_1520570 [compost metagenome]
MHAFVGGRRVREAHAQRLPARAQQRAAQAEDHAHRQFAGLARGRLAHHFHADDDRAAGLLEQHRHGFVDEVAVADDGGQRRAQVGLVGDQQADDAEVRQLARLGHAQREVVATAFRRRVFQQGHAGCQRHAEVRIGQQAALQADLAQQGLHIEPARLRHFEEIGERRGAYPCFQAVSPGLRARCDPGHPCADDRRAWRELQSRWKELSRAPRPPGPTLGSTRRKVCRSA